MLSRFTSFLIRRGVRLRTVSFVALWNDRFRTVQQHQWAVRNQPHCVQLTFLHLEMRSALVDSNDFLIRKSLHQSLEIPRQTDAGYLQLVWYIDRTSQSRGFCRQFSRDEFELMIEPLNSPISTSLRLGYNSWPKRLIESLSKDNPSSSLYHAFCPLPKNGSDNKARFKILLCWLSTSIEWTFTICQSTVSPTMNQIFSLRLPSFRSKTRT